MQDSNTMTSHYCTVNTTTIMMKTQWKPKGADMANDEKIVQDYFTKVIQEQFKKICAGNATQDDTLVPKNCPELLSQTGRRTSRAACDIHCTRETHRCESAQQVRALGPTSEGCCASSCSTRRSIFCHPNGQGRHRRISCATGRPASPSCSLRQRFSAFSWPSCIS